MTPFIKKIDVLLIRDWSVHIRLLIVVKMLSRDGMTIGAPLLRWIPLCIIAMRNLINHRSRKCIFKFIGFCDDVVAWYRKFFFIWQTRKLEGINGTIVVHPSFMKIAVRTHVLALPAVAIRIMRHIAVCNASEIVRVARFYSFESVFTLIVGDIDVGHTIALFNSNRARNLNNAYRTASVREGSSGLSRKLIANAFSRP